MEESRQPSLPKEVFPPRRRDAPIFQRMKHRSVSITNTTDDDDLSPASAAAVSSPTSSSVSSSPHAQHCPSYDKKKDTNNNMLVSDEVEGSPIARSEGGMSSVGLQTSPSPSPPKNTVVAGGGDPSIGLGRRSGSFRSRRHSQLLDAKDADAAFLRSPAAVISKQPALRRVESLCAALQHNPSPPMPTTNTPVVVIPTAVPSSSPVSPTMMVLEDVLLSDDGAVTTSNTDVAIPHVTSHHNHPTVSLRPPSKDSAVIVCLLCLHHLSTDPTVASSKNRTSQCTCSVPIPFPMAGGVLPTPLSLHDGGSVARTHRHLDDTAIAMCPTCRSSVTKCTTTSSSSSVCPSCYTQYCWSCEQWGYCLCGSSRSDIALSLATCPAPSVTFDVCASWSSCRFCGDDCSNPNGSLLVQDIDESNVVAADAVLLGADVDADDNDILIPDLSAAAGGGVELNLNPRQEQYVRDNRARTSNWIFTEESGENAKSSNNEGAPLGAKAASVSVPAIPDAAGGGENGVDEEGNIRVRMAAFFSSLARGVFGNGSETNTPALHNCTDEEVSEGDLSSHNPHNSTAPLTITTSPSGAAVSTSGRQRSAAVVGQTTRNMWGEDTTMYCTTITQNQLTKKDARSTFKQLFTGVSDDISALQQQQPRSTSSSLSIVRDCCKSVACQHQARSVCGRALPCGHPCYGTPHIIGPLPVSSEHLPPDAHLHVRPCMPCLQEGCPAHGLTGKALLLKLKDIQVPLPSKAVRRLILTQGRSTPNSDSTSAVGPPPSQFLSLPSSQQHQLLPIVDVPPTHQTSDDSCCICYTDPLMGRGCIQLESCGHVLHLDCVLERLKHRWPSKRISFNYLCCPICNLEMQSRVLEEVMRPHLAFRGYITTMILSRIEAEGLKKCAALTDPSSEYYHNPVAYGMRFLSFYTCHKCACPYFGGFNWCDAVLPPEGAAVENEGDDDWEGGDGRGGAVVAGGGVGGAEARAAAVKDVEYCCNDCTVGKDKSNCVVHGKHFIQYKCRFCCSVARWFCWGTTRFCNDCHTAQTGGNYLNKKRPFELPQCGSYWSSAPLIEGMERAPPKVPIPLTDLPSLEAKMQLLRTIHSRRYSLEDGGGADANRSLPLHIPAASSSSSEGQVSMNKNNHQSSSALMGIQQRALMELRSASLLRILVELSSNQTRPTQPSTMCSSLGVVHPPNGAGEYCLGCSLCAAVERN